ncbi:MAG: phospholipase D-like domain-containing protein [Thermincolia bacterium]
MRGLEESNHQRPLVLVVDGCQVLYGVVSQGQDSQATWTGDKGFVTMAEDYILHDISINKVMSKLKGEECRELEEELDRIRARFLGLDEEEVRWLGGGWPDDR